MEFPDDPLAAHWLSLGKFVHRYAEIESAMHHVLRIVANVPDRTARAMFSGTRVSQATDTVKRIYAARKESIPSYLVKAFSKIGDVTKARDRLLHHGMQFESGKIIVTDETKNLSSRAFKHEVSIADLSALEEDATTIQACLLCFRIEARRPDLIGTEIHLDWTSLAQVPWRYKSPKPMKTRGVSRGSVRERKGPPQP